MCLIREEILIDGDVQGVGFRPYIEKIAKKQGIVGFAENLHFRPVKLVCEGEEEIVDSFLDKIREHAPFHITTEKIEVLEREIIEKLSFKSFEIVKDREITLEHIDERLQTGVNVMISMNNKLDKLDSKLDKLDSIEKGQEKMISILEDNRKDQKTVIKLLEKISDKI